MLVFIGLVCISFALVLGLSCIMLYQIFYQKGGTIGPLLGKVLSICALQVPSRKAAISLHICWAHFKITSRINSSIFISTFKIHKPLSTSFRITHIKPITSPSCTNSLSHITNNLKFLLKQHLFITALFTSPSCKTALFHFHKSFMHNSLHI